MKYKIEYMTLSPKQYAGEEPIPTDTEWLNEEVDADSKEEAIELIRQFIVDQAPDTNGAYAELDEDSDAVFYYDGETESPSSVLTDFKVVKSRETVKDIRERTGLSQSAFAEKYRIPVGTLMGWEINRREPPEYVVGLLKRAVEEDFK